MLNRVLDLSTKINVYNCLKSLINTGITCTTFSNVFYSEYAYTSSISVSSNPEDAFLFLFENTNELNFIVYWISYCIWEGKSCVLLRCSILVVFGSYKLNWIKRIYKEGKDESLEFLWKRVCDLASLSGH